jgi:hypothetical protein
MKVRPVGGESFHVNRGTEGSTDMTKPVVAFRNFVNAPKISAGQTTSSASQCQIIRNRTKLCASPFTVFVTVCDLLWNPRRLVQQISERSWQAALCSLWLCRSQWRMWACFVPCVCLKCENGPHVPGALHVCLWTQLLRGVGVTQCSKCAARASAGA